MKLLTSVFFLFFLTVQLHAQNTAEQWEKDPVSHEAKFIFRNESAVILSDLRTQEFVQSEKKGMRVILTTKKLIRLSDHNGVEMYNKIYVPLYHYGEIRQLKARVILNNGKVINSSSD